VKMQGKGAIRSQRKIAEAKPIGRKKQ